MNPTIAWNDNSVDETAQVLYGSNTVNGQLEKITEFAKDIETAQFVIPAQFKNAPLYLAMTAKNDKAESAPSNLTVALDREQPGFPMAQLNMLRKDLYDNGKLLSYTGGVQGTLGTRLWTPYAVTQPDGKIFVWDTDGGLLVDPVAKTVSALPDEAKFVDDTGYINTYNPIISRDGKLYSFFHWVIREHTGTSWREVATIPVEQQALCDSGQSYGMDEHNSGVLANGDLLYMFLTAVPNVFCQTRVDVNTGVCTSKLVTIPLSFEWQNTGYFHPLDNGHVLWRCRAKASNFEWHLIEWDPVGETFVDTKIPYNINTPDCLKVIGDKLIFVAKKEQGSYDPAHYWVIPYVPGQPFDFSSPGVAEPLLDKADDFYLTVDGRVLVTAATPANIGKTMLIWDPLAQTIVAQYPDIADASFNDFNPRQTVVVESGYFAYESSGLGRYRQFTFAQPAGLELGSLCSVSDY